MARTWWQGLDGGPAAEVAGAAAAPVAAAVPVVAAVADRKLQDMQCSS